MKKFSLLGFLLISSLALVSCAQHQTVYHARINENLLRESWMQQINTDPNRWTVGADPWYFSFQAAPLTQYAVNAPVQKSMTDMLVRVPNFTDINVYGDFRVQIVGGQDFNSVEMIGPNNSVRQISVSTRNNTLFIHRSKDCTKDCNANLREVVVRIGIHELRNLTDCGRGGITGKNISSNMLMINARCSGNILLGGDMNLVKVTNSGSGTVTVIGAYSPNVDLSVINRGTINVSGRVGVRSINNYGVGQINIIGADSNGLVINARQSSITKIAGYVNLKKLNAYENSRVYIYWVNSNGVYVNQGGNSRVGLAGCATNMNLDMSGRSCFQGQYLRVGSAYVRTRDGAHATITADQKVFAEASGNSSIYFFGSPSIVSRFISDNATIVPVWTNEIATPPVLYRQPYHWDFKGQASH